MRLPRASRLPLHRHRLPLLLMAFGMLLAIAAVTLWRLNEFSRSFDLVRKTMDTLETIDDIEATLISAESNGRGFRIYRQPTFLEAYGADKRHVHERLQAVREQPDDPGLARQLRTIEARITERMAVLDLLNAREGGTGDPSPALQQQALHGIAVMNRIRSDLQGLRNALQRKLMASHARLDRSARWLAAFIIGGFLLAIGILLALTRSLIRQSQTSAALELEATTALQALERSHATVTAMSEHRAAIARYSSLLQSCQHQDEAMQATRTVLEETLPNASGQLYLLRASQNAAECALNFGGAAPTVELFTPDQCWALRRGLRHLSEPDPGTVRCLHLPHVEADPSDGVACVPLAGQGSALGVLSTRLDAGGDRQPQLEILSGIAEQLSLALANLQLRDTLRHQSIRDELTGLFNRRYLQENLDREISRSMRRNLPLSALMIDVDHFKAFNDRHGHPAGDAMLAAIGRQLREMTREEDIVCRYGGEEFILVLPECDHAMALRKADAIRTAVAGLEIEFLRQRYLPATLSIGVASVPQHAVSAESLLARADAALYRAKHAGRNRVESARADD